MSGLFLYKSFEMPKINDKRADGFTLVELAIVMIIIGLLIGGVLKGQELIANAQVTSTVAQIKGIKAAALTFRDQYQALPGDMSRATVRLPNCTAPCVNGNGDDRLNIIAGITAESEGENIQFWVHMNKADVFSGVDGTTQPSWGEGMPKADVGGGFGVSFSSGDLVGATSAINAAQYAPRLPVALQIQCVSRAPRRRRNIMRRPIRLAVHYIFVFNNRNRVKNE